ncbi:MAG: AI-2E family transporter [Paracoccus sp. (in: a-proteobacteria)]|nr:AI-2E family transporter [Paracoccus sp. (in: a-proteobacteria)]
MLRENDPLRGLMGVVLWLMLVVLAGFLMIIGKAFLLPIIIAVISVYVLVAASNALARLPWVGRAPEWARRLAVLLGFVVFVFWLGGVMMSTATQVSVKMPEYQQNIDAIYNDLTGLLDFDARPDINEMLERMRAALPLREIATTVLGSISSAAGLIFMVLVYAVFLMGERGGFARKIAVALPGDRAARTHRIIAEVNGAIGEYITVKTLVNAILGVLSFVTMAVLGVDFALFWAVMIALLNYIPYIGSMLGVVFPVMLSMAQFGSVQKTLMVAALLTAAQIWVGNSLEPRMVGRRVNMSPFVVLVALALWSSVWGVAGAILAIPLTAIAAIIMASFDSTRPFAVLLAENVEPFEADSSAAPAGQPE